MAKTEKKLKYSSRFPIDVLVHVSKPNVTITEKKWKGKKVNNKLFRRLPNFEIGGGADHEIEITVYYDDDDIKEATTRGGKLCLYYKPVRSKWTDVAILTNNQWALTGHQPGNITAVSGTNGILIVTATSWPDPPLGWGFS